MIASNITFASLKLILFQSVNYIQIKKRRYLINYASVHSGCQKFKMFQNT